MRTVYRITLETAVKTVRNGNARYNSPFTVHTPFVAVRGAIHEQVKTNFDPATDLLSVFRTRTGNDSFDVVFTTTDGSLTERLRTTRFRPLDCDSAVYSVRSVKVEAVNLAEQCGRISTARFTVESALFKGRKEDNFNDSVTFPVHLFFGGLKRKLQILGVVPPEVEYNPATVIDLEQTHLFSKPVTVNRNVKTTAWFGKVTVSVWKEPLRVVPGLVEDTSSLAGFLLGAGTLFGIGVKNAQGFGRFTPWWEGYHAETTRRGYIVPEIPEDRSGNDSRRKQAGRGSRY